MHERCTKGPQLADLAELAHAIQALPITLAAARARWTRPSAMAGGVPSEVLNRDRMLEALPAAFCAGEMLDWKPPPWRLL